MNQPLDPSKPKPTLRSIVVELAPAIGGFLLAWWWLDFDLWGSDLVIFLVAFFAVYAAILLWRHTS